MPLDQDRCGASFSHCFWVVNATAPVPILVESPTLFIHRLFSGSRVCSMVENATYNFPPSKKVRYAESCKSVILLR